MLAAVGLIVLTEATRIVIAAGTVAESGPPDGLLASGGMFAQLAAREEL